MDSPTATGSGHGAGHYVRIWAVLLGALVVSLVLGAITNSPWAIAIIFAVATAKAALVLAHFMHVKLEPRWIRLIGAGAVAVVGVFFIGLVPDIVYKFGFVPGGIQSAQANPANTVAKLPPDAGRGATVYATFCLACHQADGRGKNGTLAADFVSDASRLAKPDSELLASIANGRQANGLSMPPWKDALTAQQRADALAYIRTQFGRKP
ncbi:MAG: c-type cytochrome [Deltaproteobacteria bacterium]|nr:c-type cytochrome [Deltaproteobacteria bacterium]